MLCIAADSPCILTHARDDFVFDAVERDRQEQSSAGVMGGPWVCSIYLLVEMVRMGRLGCVQRRGLTRRMLMQ